VWWGSASTLLFPPIHLSHLPAVSVAARGMMGIRIIRSGDYLDRLRGWMDKLKGVSRGLHPNLIPGNVVNSAITGNQRHDIELRHLLTR